MTKLFLVLIVDIHFSQLQNQKHYENQIVKTRTKDGVITLTETPAPKLDDTAIKKIFFFMFKDVDVEKQVLIYLPEDTREGAPNEIKIIGDNVIYAKQVDKTDKAE